MTYDKMYAKGKVVIYLSGTTLHSESKAVWLLNLGKHSIQLTKKRIKDKFVKKMTIVYMCTDIATNYHDILVQAGYTEIKERVVARRASLDLSKASLDI